MSNIALFLERKRGTTMEVKMTPALLTLQSPSIGSRGNPLLLLSFCFFLDHLYFFSLSLSSQATWEVIDHRFMASWVLEFSPFFQVFMKPVLLTMHGGVPKDTDLHRFLAIRCGFSKQSDCHVCVNYVVIVLLETGSVILLTK